MTNQKLKPEQIMITNLYLCSVHADTLKNPPPSDLICDLKLQTTMYSGQKWRTTCLALVWANLTVTQILKSRKIPTSFVSVEATFHRDDLSTRAQLSSHLPECLQPTCMFACFFCCVSLYLHADVLFCPPAVSCVCVCVPPIPQPSALCSEHAVSLL